MNFINTINSLMTLRILVTGGSGLVGDAIYNERHNYNKNINVEWCFLSSSDCNLCDISNVEDLFNSFEPEIVVHLAAKDKIKSKESTFDIFTDNVKININILDACKKYKVKRLINVLNDSLSKKILCGASKLLNNEKGFKKELTVINLIPNNLFGKNDNYNLLNGNIIPSLIHKFYIAERNNKNVFLPNINMHIKYIYANDFAKIILELLNLSILENYVNIYVDSNSIININIIIDYLINNISFDKLVIFNKVSVKTGIYYIDYINNSDDIKELKYYLPNFEFTSFKRALKETVEHFKNNYNKMRK